VSLRSASPLKILVVDDDRSTRMLLKAFLSRSGHTIVEAANGEEAVDAFERENPELILMDVTMPVMTGYEAAVIIKQRCGNRFVPIIFLTGLNDDKSLAKCVESGGDDFLVKPFNSVLLGAKVTAMQRIRELHLALEQYQQRTEQEIALTHHIFKALTQRMSTKSIPGMDHWMRSAGHFSGDLMIFEKSPAGKLYLMLGDFTGHGFSAAIGALPTSDVFFSMAQQNLPPVEILAEINRKLHEIMPTGHFCATAFVCCDPVSRQIDIFNAGLPPVLLLDAHGNIKASVKSSNLALGILPQTLFTAELATLKDVTNSTLVLYSDGVTEAKNAAGEMFGEERLHAALASGKKPFDAAKAALEVFVGQHAPDDDISLTTLRL
jgi:CheY-like chemotaxis protein